MKREKSCGILAYRICDGNFFIALIRHRFGGHWTFPKGHMEKGETERQTALREVREETGLSDIHLIGGYRESVEYYPKPGIKKMVVYFLGRTYTEELVRQEEEISEICWAPLKEATEYVTFENDKKLIEIAQRRLGLIP